MIIIYATTSLHFASSKMQLVLELMHEFPLGQPFSKHRIQNSASCFKLCLKDEQCKLLAVADEALMAGDAMDHNCFMFSDLSNLLETKYEEGWRLYRKVRRYRI